MTIHGEFFENGPDFSLKRLLKFISRFNHTPKQLDVAFNDDNKCLNIEKIRYWCAFDDDFCMGSLVARTAPGELTRRRAFERIQLSSARSKTNFGTIYVRPETGFIRFEIKFKNKDKIEYLLENYSSKHPEQFESRSLGALVSCINFISHQSKMNKNAKKYIKQRPWKKFLGSDIKPIKWSKILKDKSKNRVKSDNETADKSIRRNSTIIKNMLKRLRTIVPEEEILKQFAYNSGYILVKMDSN